MEELWKEPSMSIGYNNALIIMGRAHKVSYYCFSIEQPVKRPICSNIERRFLRRLQKLSNLPKMYLSGLGLLAADSLSLHTTWDADYLMRWKDWDGSIVNDNLRHFTTHLAIFNHSFYLSLVALAYFFLSPCFIWSDSLWAGKLERECFC